MPNNNRHGLTLFFGLPMLVRLKMCKFAKSNAILEIQRAKWLKILPEV